MKKKLSIIGLALGLSICQIMPAAVFADPVSAIEASEEEEKEDEKDEKDKKKKEDKKKDEKKEEASGSEKEGEENKNTGSGNEQEPTGSQEPSGTPEQNENENNMGTPSIVAAGPQETVEDKAAGTGSGNGQEEQQGEDENIIIQTGDHSFVVINGYASVHNTTTDKFVDNALFHKEYPATINDDPDTMENIQEGMEMLKREMRVWAEEQIGDREFTVITDMEVKKEVTDLDGRNEYGEYPSYTTPDGKTYIDKTHGIYTNYDITFEVECTDEKKTPVTPDDPEKPARKLMKVDYMAPTCEVPGNKEYYYDEETGKTYWDAEGKEEAIFQTQIIIPSVGHEWDEGKVTKEATCTEAGVKTYTCKHNAEHTKTEEIKALGHEWDDGKITKQATCTEAGVKTYTCKHDAKHTKTEEIKALGHDWGQWTVVKQATTAAAGVNQRVCKHDKTHIEYQQTPILTTYQNGVRAVTPVQANSLNGTASTTINAVQTGDTSNMLLWATVTGAALLGVLGLYSLKRRMNG